MVYVNATKFAVEERDGILSGFAFKFSQKTAKAPQAWLETYAHSTFLTVNRDNYLDFLLGE